jgi:hypothetical protein
MNFGDALLSISEDVSNAFLALKGPHVRAVGIAHGALS